MATQFEIDNALMAGRAYFDTRASVNRFPVPSGWTEFFHVPSPAFSVTGGNGFEAVSFRRGTEIVIAFAGTDFMDFSGDWFLANVPLAFGELSIQLVDAARYYLEVKAANPGATISFTGHSLGGGLASLMAVQRRQHQRPPLPTRSLTKQSEGKFRVIQTFIWTNAGGAI